MRTLFVILMMGAVALAGCNSSSGSGAEDECTTDRVLCDQESYLANHYCVKNDVTPRMYAPDTPSEGFQPTPWKLGDFWSYDLEVDGEDLGRTTLVYYDDQDFDSGGVAQHYMVGTKSREEALHHAIFSSNPVIGRVHRTLYSPHESGAHADMFNFPLCEGNTWSTTFFATKFDLRASHEPVQLPTGGSDPNGFVIRGQSGGASIEIEYSPIAKWFTLIDYSGRDQDVQLDLKEFGSGRSGEHNFLRGQKDEVVDLSLQGDGVTIARAEGAEGPYDVVGIFIEATRASGTSKLEVHVRDPSGASLACVGIAGDDLVGGQTTCPSEPQLVEVPWQAGDWSVTVDSSAISPSSAAGTVRVVSIYDRGGVV